MCSIPVERKRMDRECYIVRLSLIWTNFVKHEDMTFQYESVEKIYFGAS